MLGGEDRGRGRPERALGGLHRGLLCHSVQSTRLHDPSCALAGAASDTFTTPTLPAQHDPPWLCAGCSSGWEPAPTCRSRVTTRTAMPIATAALIAKLSCTPWVNASRAVSSSVGAELVGELSGGRYPTAQAVAGGGRRLARDGGRDRVGHLTAVHGGADAAKDGDAERPAELRAGLRDCRRRAGPLRWRGADHQVGRQGRSPAPAPGRTPPTLSPAPPGRGAVELGEQPEADRRQDQAGGHHQGRARPAHQQRGQQRADDEPQRRTAASTGPPAAATAPAPAAGTGR